MKLWKQVRVAGRVYDVFLTSTEDLVERCNEEGVGHLDAFTDTATSQIVISEEIAPGRRNVVLMHELVHAMLEGNGLLFVIETLRKKTEDAEEFEELLVHLLAPLLVDLTEVWQQVVSTEVPAS